eukprot:Blabericola_migrator_1__5681@NODE_2886_length_2240_cov_224_772665_g1810_i0_p1_GENE_NODE_2886_length_2240_cov_224_772665_g1810_i0NODE_2886_length_2240_cov_224_772665_g1810_i0_p1_ORF_typecomplete_len349_score36_49_NODE_2886_length_2240_cov_224_772665_g1810_i07251771
MSSHLAVRAPPIVVSNRHMKLHYQPPPPHHPDIMERRVNWEWRTAPTSHFIRLHPQQIPTPTTTYSQPYHSSYGYVNRPVTIKSSTIHQQPSTYAPSNYGSNVVTYKQASTSSFRSSSSSFRAQSHSSNPVRYSSRIPTVTVQAPATTAIPTGISPMRISSISTTAQHPHYGRLTSSWEPRPSETTYSRRPTCPPIEPVETVYSRKPTCPPPSPPGEQTWDTRPPQVCTTRTAPVDRRAPAPTTPSPFWSSRSTTTPVGSGTRSMGPPTPIGERVVSTPTTAASLNGADKVELLPSSKYLLSSSSLSTPLLGQPVLSSSSSPKSSKSGSDKVRRKLLGLLNYGNTCYW